ncbi:MAG: putative toxin-antitoxin system toxin component, PIN family [Gammaproteobacteria bacterium]|nr:putative toxin-antitoxin system toxin component, PIN family [Gammaproteobacteria bacterium]
MTLRVVFDTNIIVSALIFSRGKLAWLRQAWQQGSVKPLVSKSTVEELLKVLTYPKFQLTGSDREELLGDFLPFAQVIEVNAASNALPTCRDEDDQKFLDLAAAGQADALVTGDADLLELADKSAIVITTVVAFRKLFGA